MAASSNQWCPLTDDGQLIKVGHTEIAGRRSFMIAGGLISCPGICKQEYNNGLTVTLYADPSDLSTFLGWKPTPSGCETMNPACQVTMDKKKSVKAIFQGPNKLKVVTTFKNGATGTVTSGDALINCPVDCGELYTVNAPVTLDDQ